MLSFTMNVFASENTPDDTYVVNEKIQDTDVLLERALNGVNDAPGQVVESIKENCVLTINGVEQTEKPLITTE